MRSLRNRGHHPDLAEETLRATCRSGLVCGFRSPCICACFHSSACLQVFQASRRQPEIEGSPGAASLDSRLDCEKAVGERLSPASVRSTARFPVLGLRALWQTKPFSSGCLPTSRLRLRISASGSERPSPLRLPQHTEIINGPRLPSALR
jgi:hypothetical protein